MKYNECQIEIYKCNFTGWRGWFEYIVTKGDQKVSGRSRGTKSEVVNLLKWRIDHNELFSSRKLQS